MSKRSKPERRNLKADELVIERVIEYPGIPPELVEELVRARDLLYRFAARITSDEYQENENRECMAIDLDDAASGIDYFLWEKKLAKPRADFLIRLDQMDL